MGCDRDQPRDRLLVHGRNQVEPCDGGIVRTAFGGLHPQIHSDHMGPEPTTWDPNQRLAYHTDDAPNCPGSSPTSSSSTGAPEAAPSLHTETSGSPLRRLGSRIRRHDQGQRAVLPHSRRVPNALPRRTATPITASGPTVTDWDHAWTVLHDRQAARLLRPASLWNAFDKNKSASDRLTADLRASRRLPTQH